MMQQGSLFVERNESASTLCSTPNSFLCAILVCGTLCFFGSNVVITCYHVECP
jgi:hypothetical protein